MENYLQGNYDYWQKGYYAPNVESYMFRIWGHILKYEFADVDGQKMLDFGCGQGSALSYFRQLGFNVYGVDISEPDIEICKKRMENVSEHFETIEPLPCENDVWFEGGFSLVTAFQSLYYYSDEDLHKRLISLNNQMKPGALFVATMMGTKANDFFDNSKPYKDGLRLVEFKNTRLEVKNYYVNFIESKEQLIEKFKIFEKLHTGFYDYRFREDEGCGFHWTFVGRKKD